MLITENQLRQTIRRMLDGRNSHKIEIYVNSQPLYVEVADTDVSRDVGLMNRADLKRNEGMLFIFPDSSRRAFWMKNTYIPLSIAYLNESGEILNIEKMSPQSDERVWSSGPAMYALEVNDGWFDSNKISIGDIVRGLPTISK